MTPHRLTLSAVILSLALAISPRVDTRAPATIDLQPAFRSAGASTSFEPTATADFRDWPISFVFNAGQAEPPTLVTAAASTTSFEDVPERHWAYHYIETLYQHGYVAGCSAIPRRYCPDDPLTRAQMAVFIVRGVYGRDYTPPNPTVQIFSDVPLASWAAKWIHKAYADGYTTGCATNPLRYCPDSAHTRADATVYFLRILNGRNYNPPSPRGLFADVPVGASHAAWVEAAYTASLIPPCQIYPQLRFCPNVPISRAMAAYVMTQVKGLISSPDIRVLNMEITQGIQNLANDMPLVAGRETYVRAYVRSTVFRELYGVPARLRAFRNGVELPGSPRAPNNAGKAITVRSSTGDRLSLEDSYWFYVPKDWRSGTVTFRVEVNNDLTVPESDISGNLKEVTKTFNVGENPALMFVPLHLHDHGDRNNPVLTYYATNPTFAGIVSNLHLYHPVAAFKVSILTIPEFPVGHGFPVFHEWFLETEAGENELASYLYVKSLLSRQHWIGMVHPGVATRDGGWTFVKAAWVRMNSDWGPRWQSHAGAIMGHELGHIEGLRHVLCHGNEGNPDPQYPWPFPNCQLAEVDPAGYYGLDVYYSMWGQSRPTVISPDPQAASPHQAFPLMGYQAPWWVSPWEYCKLLNRYGINCGLFGMAEAQANEAGVDPLAVVTAEERQALEGLAKYFIVGGHVSTSDGTELTTVYQIDYALPGVAQYLAERLGHSRAVAGRAGPTYSLVQLGTAGQQLASDVISPTSDYEGGDVLHFLEVIPFAQGAARLQIRRDGVVLAERVASASLPSVQLLEPNGGGTLAPGTVVRWVASDPDGDSLTFNIFYSPDNGQTWQPIVLDWRGDSLELTSLADLPGSAEGRMRVTANDGFHAARDESDETFGVPDAPPWAIILRPSRTFAETGSLIVLQGLAGDAKDGPLTGASLTWRSDRDGELGTGDEIATEALSPGTHQITLTATDSQGQTASASITLDVGVYRVSLPIVLK